MTGDWDNFAKSISDGITKAGNVWRDDRYVLDARVMLVGKSLDHPRAEVEVRVLCEEERTAKEELDDAGDDDG